MAENNEKNMPRIDDSEAYTGYANFCRVAGSPEELIIDFGLNSQPMGGSPQDVSITQRVVLNYYTAKRMLHALQMSIQRHEQMFGTVETDIKKRMIEPPKS